MKSDSPAPRPYRQTARARAAQETGIRLVEAFSARLREHWFDEIRLEDVARDGGVTVQTLIRRFGGKEGLLDAAQARISEEIRARRAQAPARRPGAAGAIAALAADYEEVGDFVLRMLAQEGRHPAIRNMADFGRAGHRQWVAENFALWLDPLAGEARRRALDALVVACDVYVWKLLRRDMGRPLAEYRALVAAMAAAALGLSPQQLNETGDA
ncbi:MAG: TetR family transcriptional regulator [Sphingomonadaceae bacterium]|nr:TetR family transcriptional regulator [Sphingomonadaceae bacterium]